MRQDGLQQIGCAAVVEEKDPLTQTPQGSRPELPAIGLALRDAVCEACTHVMDLKIAVR